MKEISDLILPDDVGYTKDHEWARKEGDEVVVGISDYAQDQLGDVVFVELPQPGDTLARGDEFGTVESVKAVAEVYLPVGGEIVAVNEVSRGRPRAGQHRALQPAAGWSKSVPGMPANWIN
jgi:glycine cleavage system H protein